MLREAIIRWLRLDARFSHRNSVGGTINGPLNKAEEQPFERFRMGTVSPGALKTMCDQIRGALTSLQPEL